MLRGMKLNREFKFYLLPIGKAEKQAYNFSVSVDE
ncbi:MAG: hypothetical protein JWN76_3477 [Chitinophagaceae bacterium]|nr:hypothetical protein [Chitinophagaceae bacterium]